MDYYDPRYPVDPLTPDEREQGFGVIMLELLGASELTYIWAIGRKHTGGRTAVRVRMGAQRITYALVPSGGFAPTPEDAVRGLVNAPQ